ncbi:MAG TPA: transcription elongation factor GreA [Candidatus Limnocylindria bacterium]|nr:transcription elongation factor GreA [Candidatus Limnocylindria bacterium]
MTPAQPGAADLLRSIGLLADGPVRWGLPVPARKSGLYVVELGVPRTSAPLEMTRVGKWLERLPGLQLDGAHPNSRALAARLASFWWPDSTILYAGATDRSAGGRAAALLAHVPGDRQPHPDGQWLHVLTPLERLQARIWWAETDAPEEYLDAFFDAFAAGRGAAPGRPEGALPLPWANTRRPTGERQAHGITGSLLPAVAKVPEPPRRVVEVEPGDAEGARPEPRGAGTTRRAPTRSAAPAQRRAPAIAKSSTGGRTGSASRPAEPVQVSQGALDRMAAELDELTRVKRGEVISRIKAAREHGDLKENAEYHAARAEQSFLEGRVQSLEDRLRRAVVVEEAVTGRVTIGSTVTVEIGGDELRYTLVGSTEADPAAGRLSVVSPVGRALLGAAPGADVEVRTPRGAVRYRVVSVD